METVMEWLTLAEVSSRANLCEAEASRRLDNFERYMGGRNFGDIVKYPPQTVELMVGVTNLYRLGWNTEDIEELLQMTFREVAAAVGPQEMHQSRMSLLALKASYERLAHDYQRLKTLVGHVQHLASRADGREELEKAKS